MKELTELIDANRMRKDVEHLASFPTRNTNTPQLEVAAEWMLERYKEIKGVEAELWKYKVAAGRRVVADKDVVEVVANLKGTSDRRILIGGHMDTINMSQGSNPMTSIAPGANDDGSGTILALEVARAMADVPRKQTCMFAAFTGEEQGLLGSRALAQRAKAEGWKLDAVLSNDMVGNSSNNYGQKDDKRVRVFSDEPSAENATANSRELARFVEWITRGRVKGFGVKLVFRADRFGRGGDHTPFHQAGFPAVRIVEVHEEYSRQHTENDLAKFMDWKYLANCARINLLAYASLANADEPPTSVRVGRDQGHDTTLTWKAKPGVCYAVYWRETTSPIYQECHHAGEVDSVTIKKVNKDDHVFAVGAEGGCPIEAL